MTTEERFTVQGDLNVWWMRNRFTDQHQTRHGRLFVATVSLITTRVVYANMSSAVEYLWERYILKRDQGLVCQITQLYFYIPFPQQKVSYYFNSKVTVTVATSILDLLQKWSQRSNVFFKTQVLHFVVSFVVLFFFFFNHSEVEIVHRQQQRRKKLFDPE